jgi:hypothetical protein
MKVNFAMWVSITLEKDKSRNLSELIVPCHDVRRILDDKYDRSRTFNRFNFSSVVTSALLPIVEHPFKSSSSSDARYPMSEIPTSEILHLASLRTRIVSDLRG